jgi:hypothetical protein
VLENENGCCGFIMPTVVVLAIECMMVEAYNKEEEVELDICYV